MTFFELKEKLAFKIVRHIPTLVHPLHITYLRLVLVIPLIFLLLTGHTGWTIALFIFMAFSDYIDGPLARQRQQITTAGKLLDPFADKLMVLPVFYITGISFLPGWLIWATIGLEILLILLVFLLKPFFEKIGQRRSLGANKFGKYKMTLQTVGVLWLLLLPRDGLADTLVYYLFIIALILSALSIAKHLAPQSSHDQN